MNKYNFQHSLASEINKNAHISNNTLYFKIMQMLQGASYFMIQKKFKLHIFLRFLKLLSSETLHSNCKRCMIK